MSLTRVGLADMSVSVDPATTALTVRAVTTVGPTAVRTTPPVSARRVSTAVYVIPTTQVLYHYTINRLYF